MGRFRTWMKQLERTARADQEFFELTSGERYYFDRQQVDKQLVLFCFDAELGDPSAFNEPPEILLAILRARDPEEVLQRFAPRHSTSALNLGAVLDEEALIRERRLAPAPLDSRPA